MQAECLAAKTPALAAVQGYHDKIPVRNTLDFGPSLARGPQSDLAAIGPVCFNGADCETPAPPPTAADPGSIAPAAAPSPDGPGQDVPVPAPEPGKPGSSGASPSLGSEPWTSTELERSGAVSSGCAAVALLAVAAAVAAAAPALHG